MAACGTRAAGPRADAVGTPARGSRGGTGGSHSSDSALDLPRFPWISLFRAVELDLGHLFLSGLPPAGSWGLWWWLGSGKGFPISWGLAVQNGARQELQSCWERVCDSGSVPVPGTALWWHQLSRLLL